MISMAFLFTFLFSSFLFWYYVHKYMVDTINLTFLLKNTISVFRKKTLRPVIKHLLLKLP